MILIVRRASTGTTSEALALEPWLPYLLGPPQTMPAAAHIFEGQGPSLLIGKRGGNTAEPRALDGHA